MILKISSVSKPSSVAGSIVHVLNQEKKVELHTIGAGALNQAVKAIAIARGYVAPVGKNLVCVPAFFTTDVIADEVVEEEMTGIKLVVYAD